MNVRRQPENSPDTRPSGGPGLRLRAWRDLHFYSLFSSMGRMMKRPWASLLTVGVMSVALLLPLLLLVLLGNLEQLSGSFRDLREVSVFLPVDASPEQADALVEALRADSEIEQVQLRTPEDGLEEFRQRHDFAAVLALLDDNPLPAVLEVLPSAEVEPLDLAKRLEAREEVDFVQHDAFWRARFVAWLAFGQRLAWVTAFLLWIGVVLVVVNTIRLDIQGRKEEIEIVQLLGATDGFVRRPFLYLGVWYGLFAGVLALLGAGFVFWLLSGPIAALVQGYGSSFVPAGLDGARVAGTLLFSVLLGWTGAWLATGRHLRRAAFHSESVR